MNLDSRKNGFLEISVDIDELLSRCNIQRYYTEENGFDFQSFVRMALDYDEAESEAILSRIFASESFGTQISQEDSYFHFSDEELNLIYLDVLNLKTA